MKSGSIPYKTFIARCPLLSKGDRDSSKRRATVNLLDICLKDFAEKDATNSVTEKDRQVIVELWASLPRQLRRKYLQKVAAKVAVNLQW